MCRLNVQVIPHVMLPMRLNHGYTGARRKCQSVTCSYARASFNTLVSAPLGPEICKPMGSPALVKPHGTDMVGHPKRLKGAVFRMVRVPRVIDVSTSLPTSTSYTYEHRTFASQHCCRLVPFI